MDPEAKLERLEGEIKRLIEVVQRLREQNTSLEQALRQSEGRTRNAEQQRTRWERQRRVLQGRIRNALRMLDGLEQHRADRERAR